MIPIHQLVLFVSDIGSSKTATILYYIHYFDSQYTNLILNFSSRTKSIDVRMFERYLWTNSRHLIHHIS